jgi:ribosomal protein S6--L-glutamate ligase
MPLALVDRLTADGVAVRVVTADDMVLEPAADAADAWPDVNPGDVLVARTRNPFALALLRAAERPGVHVATPWESVAAVRNKAWAVQALARRGVPMPRTIVAGTTTALKSLERDRFPLVLKPHLGDNGLGIALVRDRAELDDLRWEDTVVLAQEYIETGGVDLKLYGAGERVWAVRRPSPLCAATGATTAERVPTTPDLERLAHACGSTFGLSLYGVDVLETARGPLVVDVNEFPNYTGVDEAPDVISELVQVELGVRTLEVPV